MSAASASGEYGSSAWMWKGFLSEQLCKENAHKIRNVPLVILHFSDAKMLLSRGRGVEQFEDFLGLGGTKSDVSLPPNMTSVVARA